MAGKALRFKSLEEIEDEIQQISKDAAEAYQSMDYSECVHRLRGAMDLFEMIPGVNSTKHEARHLLALALEAEGEVEEAETLYRQNWEEMSRELGPTHEDTIRGLGNFVCVFERSLRHLAAVSLLKDFIEQHGSELSPVRLGALLKDLSYAESNADLHDDAFQSIDRAIEVLKDTKSKKLIKAYDHKAGLMQERGRHSEALEIVEYTIRLAEEINCGHAIAEERLASVRVSLGLYREALPTYESIFNRSVDERDFDDLAVLRCSAMLSEIYTMLGRPADAGDHAIDVLLNTRASHKEDIELMSYALCTMIDFLMCTSRYREALELIEENYNYMLCNDAECANASRLMGEVATEFGRWSDAERYFADAIEVTIAECGESHLSTTEVQYGYTRQKLLRGRPLEALEPMQKSNEVFRVNNRAENPVLLSRETSVGLCLSLTGQSEMALVLLERNVRDTIGSVGRDTLVTVDALNGLAEAQAMAGVAQAEKALQNAREARTISYKVLEKMMRPVKAQCDSYRVEAIAYMQLNLLDSAWKALSDAEKIVVIVMGSDEHHSLCSVNWLRGEILLRQKKFSEAVEVLERTVGQFEASYPSDEPHWAHGAALVALAGAEMGCDASVDVSSTLERGKRILREATGREMSFLE